MYTTSHRGEGNLGIHREETKIKTKGFISSEVLALVRVAGAVSGPMLSSSPCAAPAQGHMQTCPRP